MDNVMKNPVPAIAMVAAMVVANAHRRAPEIVPPN
jgi:hypothetical protein